MTKTSLIRLPDWAGEEIKKYAQERGVAFATAVRCIVVEYLKKIAPAETAKFETGAASDPKEVPACQ